MKANSDSEIMHWGQAWRNDVPEFSWTTEEIKEIKGKLTKETGDKPHPSVCVALKNRSRVPSEAGLLELFPNCVRSLAKLHEKVVPIELVVADFHSDDCPLAEWLVKEAGPMPCRRLDISGSFSRGRGMNEALSS